MMDDLMGWDVGTKLLQISFLFNSWISGSFLDENS